MAYRVKKLDKKLELIKFFHKEHTREQALELIESKGNKPDAGKDRTYRNYVNEEDIKIGNVTIPFRIHENEDGYCISNAEDVDGNIRPNDMLNRSSVHPVILPLNLTEVYLLTAGILDNLGRNHYQYEAYRDIAEKIYSQLSDYGKQRIDKAGYDFISRREVIYETERKMIEKSFWKALNTAEKFGSEIKVTLIDGSYIKGKLDHVNTKLCIVQDDGNIVRLEELGIIKNIENI